MMHGERTTDASSRACDGSAFVAAFLHPSSLVIQPSSLSILMPLPMNTHVLFAVFRRNFVSYFANPTGYVFICLFVLLGAIAAFWVPRFLRQQSGEPRPVELLVPVHHARVHPHDHDGHLGRRAEAGDRRTAADHSGRPISTSCWASTWPPWPSSPCRCCSRWSATTCVLNNLASTGSRVRLRPRLDFGLFLGTYVGYWLVGLAMLGIGLVASFLTGNITIGFVLGVLFNMPLVFLARADAIFGAFGREGVLAVERWSIGQQLHDFSRGVLTLAGVAYFLVILVVMLYVSMVLIGRRHWFSGRRRWLQVGHYLVRGLALVAIAAGRGRRVPPSRSAAATSPARSSVRSRRKRAKLIADLKTERPVRIEAFISPSVPEDYVQTRLNLLTTLEELRAIGGGKLHVKIHDTDRYSDEAALAEKRYGIEPRQVTSISHGVFSVDQIFLNVAVSRGSSQADAAGRSSTATRPIEYELVRSICTVTEQKRKKLGVLNTDAQLYGGFNMQTMSPAPNWPIIDELEKQYEVVRVDPGKPITEKYDVLLAVQPSSLGPEEMNNFVAAVAAGQPTAIFEDPCADLLSECRPPACPASRPAA